MRSVQEYCTLARCSLRGKRLTASVAYGLPMAVFGATVLLREICAAAWQASAGSLASMHLDAAATLVALLLLCPLTYGVKRRTYFLHRGMDLPLCDVFVPFGGVDFFHVTALRVLIWGRALLMCLPAWFAAALCDAWSRRGEPSTAVHATLGAVRTVLVFVGVWAFVWARMRSFLCDYLLIGQEKPRAWRAFRDSDRLTRGHGDLLAAVYLRGVVWALCPPIGLPMYGAVAAGVAEDLIQENRAPRA